jgi:dolichyl-phosphate beta-glucosyltransferase
LKAKLITSPDLSIIIPAYCEEKRIGNTLDELSSFLRHDSYFRAKAVEILIVAAEAPDRTKEIVRSKLSLFTDAKLLLPGQRVGKGRDVQYGILRANGAIVMFMDADLATPLHHMETFYKACLAGIDVVIGTRNLRAYKTNGLKNWFASAGNKLYQTAGGVKIEDTQCGFKMLSFDAAQLCFSKLTIFCWGFDLEILAIAQENHLLIRAYRIKDWEDKPYSTYNDNPVQITLRSVRDFMQITINRLRGRYSSSSSVGSK